MTTTPASRSGAKPATAENEWFCGQVWSDGAIVAADEARLSPLDHGLLVGDGVFETAKIVDGTPFALTRHVGRLRYSATELGLVPPTDAEVVAAALAVTDANSPGPGGPELTRLRITLSGGAGPLGSGRGDHPVKLFVAAATTPHPTGPADVITVPWARNEKGALVGLKTTSYAENVKAIERARTHDASEAIFPNTQGQLCEGTGTNVFMVVDGQLVTPPLSSGCLAGITRQLVLDTTDAIEADISIEEFVECEEAFLTSSTRDVMPIRSIDGRSLLRVGGGATEHAQRAFASLVSQTLDPLPE